MARAICSSCSLRTQHCQCRLEVPTAGNANGDDVERASKLTRASFWTIYLFTAIAVSGCYLLFCYLIKIRTLAQPSCHLEVFVDSFSISNVSNATADWNVSFVTRSPGNGCKISLHVIKSRLLRGGNLISESFTPDYFGKLITGAQTNEPLSYAVFKTVATPLGNGGGVLWDLEVNVVSSFTGLASHGFLNVNCDGILVNVTVDSAGNVKGSLLGHMRPCEYVFRNNYTHHFRTLFSPISLFSWH